MIGTAQGNVVNQSRPVHERSANDRRLRAYTMHAKISLLNAICLGRMELMYLAHEMDGIDIDIRIQWRDVGAQAFQSDVRHQIKAGGALIRRKRPH